MSKAEPMRIQILGKEYLVACPDEEREALFASAEFLTEKMKEIRDNGKVVGADRIAVMAALNMAGQTTRTLSRMALHPPQINPSLRAQRAMTGIAHGSPCRHLRYTDTPHLLRYA